VADLSSRIESAAGEAQTSETDGLKSQDRTLAELIAADRYLAQKQAQAAGGSGMRFFRFVNKSDYEK
jgi:hypothetical protein